MSREKGVNPAGRGIAGPYGNTEKTAEGRLVLRFKLFQKVRSANSHREVEAFHLHQVVGRCIDVDLGNLCQDRQVHLHVKSNDAGDARLQIEEERRTVRTIGFCKS